jgi:hypothetical protein
MSLNNNGAMIVAVAAPVNGWVTPEEWCAAW